MADVLLILIHPRLTLAPSASFAARRGWLDAERAGAEFTAGANGASANPDIVSPFGEAVLDEVSRGRVQVAAESCLEVVVIAKVLLNVKGIADTALSMAVLDVVKPQYWGYLIERGCARKW